MSHLRFFPRMIMIATMATIYVVTNKTTTTIIVVLLSLLVLLPWDSPLFPKKYDIENKISGMGTLINKSVRHHIGGFTFKESFHSNYDKTQTTVSYHQNRETTY